MRASSPSSQFAQTPRFSAVRRSQPTAPASRPDPEPQHGLPASTATRRGLKLSRVESIDDSSQSPRPTASDAESDADEAGRPADDTIGIPQRKHVRGDDLMVEDDGWHFTATHSPKRRRLSRTTTPSPPRDPVTHHPPSPLRFATPARPPAAAPFRGTPAPSTTASARRFFPTPAPVAQDPHQLTTPARPAFLRPAAPTPDPTAAPLPDAFSPRKNTKDVPGGMAAEVRSWIAEVSGTAIARRYAEPATRAELQAIKQIGAAKEPKALARGSYGESLLLIGPGTGGDATPGRTVGLWLPTWGVNAGGERWSIGVDWRVIDDTQHMP